MWTPLKQLNVSKNIVIITFHISITCNYEQTIGFCHTINAYSPQWPKTHSLKYQCDEYLICNLIQNTTKKTFHLIDSPFLKLTWTETSWPGFWKIMPLSTSNHIYLTIALKFYYTSFLSCRHFRSLQLYYNYLFETNFLTLWNVAIYKIHEFSEILWVSVIFLKIRSITK